MVYHFFTGVRIWASLGKAGITRIAYNFKGDHTTHMRPLDDMTSTEMFPCWTGSVMIGTKLRITDTRFRVKLKA